MSRRIDIFGSICYRRGNGNSFKTQIRYPTTDCSRIDYCRAMSSDKWETSGNARSSFRKISERFPYTAFQLDISD